MKKIQKILCPVDFSTSSEYALEYALFLASMCMAEVVLLHVMEPSMYTTDRVDHDEKTVSEETIERLEAMAAGISQDIQVSVVVDHGVAYDEITRHARDAGCDMIVIGTHGRTGMRHLLIGSVAEKVVRTASCPVVTVRHPELDLNQEPGE